MRIVSIQDISCLGQCSNTVALPVLSAFGIETAVLPSALLSTHTTSFTGYTNLNLTRELEKITDHWIKENIHFDGMLCGYIADTEQFPVIEKVRTKLMRDNSIFILDPAMADDGELYPGLDDKTVSFMKHLSHKRDYILPNISEICFMTDTLYKEKPSENELYEMAVKLQSHGAKNIIVTGYSDNGNIGAFCLLENGETFKYTTPKREKSYPGTGDVFTSVVSAMLFSGESVQDSVKYACEFVGRCIDKTMTDTSHFYGVKFEEVLKEKIDK